MDLENFRAFFLARQVHVKDFVEASFAQQFRRKLRNIIRGADDEHRRVFLREPGQKSPEHARGGAAVGCAGALRADECLVNFVHPQHRRRDGLRHANRAPDIFLRRPDKAAEHPAHVEPQQRQLPQPRDRLGAKTFAAALHAEQQNAFRRRQTERPRLVGERDGAFDQPVLQHRQAADVREILVAA